MINMQQFLQDKIDNGMGVREISRKTGVGASTISRVATGKVKPDLDTAERILKKFGYILEIKRIKGDV